MREHHTYADMMRSVFNQLLDKGSDGAWVATLRIDFRNRERDHEPAVGGYLQLACFAPNNYVHVLAAFTERPVDVSALDKLDWQPIACHDSAWREAVSELVTSTYNVIGRAAVTRLGCIASELTPNLHLELLKQVPGRQTLASGLAKPQRHGKLSLPQFEGVA